MGITIGFVLVIFVPLCVVLTLIILLQDSKGEGLSSSAFGGAEMQSVLGGRGAATFLGKTDDMACYRVHGYFTVPDAFLWRRRRRGTHADRAGNNTGSQPNLLTPQTTEALKRLQMETVETLPTTHQRQNSTAVAQTGTE